MTTYAEKELQPLGFHLVSEERDALGFARQVVLSLSHLKLLFDCACPAYPNISALGCPLHHDGPGGSWPIETAKRLPGTIST